MLKQLLEEIGSLLKSDKLKDPSEFVSSLIDKEGNLKEDFASTLKSTFQNHNTSFFDEGFSDGKIKGISEGKKQGMGRAERENKEKWEKEIAEVFGVEAAPVSDMAKAYSEKIMAGAKTKDITEQDILNSEYHLKLMGDKDVEINEWKSKHDSLETKQNVSSRIDAFSKILKPHFVAKYNGTEKMFDDILRAYAESQTFEIDGDNYIPMDGENKIRKENREVYTLLEHFDETKLKDFFPLLEKTPQSPGDKGGAGDPPPTTDYKFDFKSHAELAKAIRNETDAARKTALIDYSYTLE